ncbi:RNA 2'-phosphotransferase [Burkholderia multivorans]|uniref:RNA 2'-phosphotransferase n=1 Tax=Burkholderia multivorans TaxID=87883 RepID=UPI0021596AEE|nr:RNA 2'-phosphotransferase [Burkholderia multivorans]
MTIDIAKLNEISRYLSYILRHKPESIGLQLDTEGWADIAALIACTGKHGHAIDKTTDLPPVLVRTAVRVRG